MSFYNRFYNQLPVSLSHYKPCSYHSSGSYFFSLFCVMAGVLFLLSATAGFSSDALAGSILQDDSGRAKVTSGHFFRNNSRIAVDFRGQHKVHPNNNHHKVKNKKAFEPTLDQMIGQMLMMGFNGIEPHDAGSVDARKLLEAGKIGGLIFMGHNMRDKEQIARLVHSMKKTGHRYTPPLLAIDQEGGFVQRLQSKHGFTPIPTARSIALDDNQDQAFRTYQTLAKELGLAGFNVNFGPVVDLNLVPENPIIGQKERSYGKKAKTVQTFARAFVLAHRQYNILTSLKHFPGHGSSWTDSHEQFVDLTNSWRDAELLPYRMLVKQHLVDMVMVGHLFHPSFSDGDKIPASLSKRAIQGVLRKDIGYRGIVITDDLTMGAIKKYFTMQEALVMAVNAGNDILLIVDGKYTNGPEIKRIHGIIRKAVRDGLISLQRIRSAYYRVLSAKKLVGMNSRKPGK